MIIIHCYIMIPYHKYHSR